MKILIVSNMYPDLVYPSYGVFVKRFVEEVEAIDILCDKSVMLKKDGKFQKMLSYITFYLSAFLKCVLKKYDIVYIHYASHSSVPVLLASKIKKLNIYTNVHGSDVIPENRSQQNMQKCTENILKISKKVIVPSEYFKDIVSSKYNMNKDKIHVYPSAGVNNDIFYEYSVERKEILKKGFNISDEYPVFGMAGRLTSNKGWKTFVDAILMLEDIGIKANYIIVGDGPDEYELIKVLKDKNIENKIIRFGLLEQNKLADFYNIIDCFIFPTQREGESLGLVALEAMACGTPVISSDIAAPSYYVINNYNGFKFNPFSSKELSERIKTMIDIINSGENQPLIDAAKTTAEKYLNNNISAILKKILMV